LRTRTKLTRSPAEPGQLYSRSAEKATYDLLERRSGSCLQGFPSTELVHRLAAFGERVSGVAHELSSPLTTILGLTQRLLQRGKDSALSGTVELRSIASEAERAVRIVRQLLEQSRELTLVHEIIQCNDVVDRVLEVEQHSLPGGTIAWKVQKEPGLPLIRGNFEQLQQVLLNLVQNAKQAIELSGRGSCITVYTRTVSPGRIQLEVSDDGPGIPPAIRARIFDPFFTTKPPGLGTGLGLAIVAGFVREHGGTVAVASSPQGGASFVVEFPVAHEPSAELFPVQKVSPGRSSGTARIAVIENEPTIRNLLVEVLRDEGMQVELFSGGRLALGTAALREADLIICDWKMPGMDGREFYERLRDNQPEASNHILFVTGDAISPRTRAFLELHELPFVAKPFRVNELLEAVRGMLRGTGHALAKRASSRSRSLLERK